MTISLVLSSFLAGVLTIFSPCILPMVPFVVRSSWQKNKLGPIFLALGLALSFSISTFLIATSGQFIGLSPDNLKFASGLFLLIASFLFLYSEGIDKLSRLLAPLNSKLQKISFGPTLGRNSLALEFLNGLLLGPVWAPCSGPTLAIIMGIIINNPEVKSSMILLGIFSIGSILPILFIAYGAKEIVSKFQSKGLKHSKKIKIAMGLFCALMSVLILTGLDKKLEALLLSVMPEFITNISLTI